MHHIDDTYLAIPFADHSYDSMKNHDFSWIFMNIPEYRWNIHGKPWHIRQCCPLWPLEFWNTTRLQAQWRVTCLQAHDHAGARRVIVVFVCYCNLTIDFCSLMDIDCVYIYMYDNVLYVSLLLVFIVSLLFFDGFSIGCWLWMNPWCGAAQAPTVSSTSA